jgi:hypothetical protein
MLKPGTVGGVQDLLFRLVDKMFCPMCVLLRDAVEEEGAATGQ